MHDKHDKTHGEGIDRELHDPISDKLVPLEPLDLSKIHSVDDLVRAMGTHSLHRPPGWRGRRRAGSHGPRQGLFRGDDTCRRNDRRQARPDHHRADRSRRRECHHLDRRSDGHGLVEAAGRSHFKYDPKMDDMELYEAGYNRVYDTLEPETNLDFVETIVARILEGLGPQRGACARTS